VRDTNSTAAKKGGTEGNTKRARSDTATSTLPPFKVGILVNTIVVVIKSTCVDSNSNSILILLIVID